MKLEELHVPHARSRTASHRHAIAGRDVWVGGVEVDLPGAPGRENRHARCERLDGSAGDIEHIGPEAAILPPRAIAVAKTSSGDEELRKELIAHVRKQIGAIATPDQVRFTDALPKTRSGKIMRRLLRDIAAGRESAGDTTTLEDLSVLAKLRESDD